MKATWIAGFAAPFANTCTRNGTYAARRWRCAPGRSVSRDPRRQHELVGGLPATVTLRSTRTAVVGPTLASACSAACCGVSGRHGKGGTAASDGSATCVTVLSVLSHSHPLLPFLMTSLSLRLCGTAIR